MSRRVNVRMRVYGAVLLGIALWGNPLPALAQALPSGWATTDIGSTGAKGAASGSGASFTVAGAGGDIWLDSDAFHFTYRKLTGDGSIQAQVTSIQKVDVWTKVGVMMRDSLSASAGHASMFVTPGKGVVFQRRKHNGTESYNTSFNSATAPYYVKIVRSGSSLAGYASKDGAAWTLVGTTTVDMGSTIYVGLAVGSHANGKLATATFASTAISGSVSGSPAPPDVSTPAPVTSSSAPPPPPPPPAPKSNDQGENDNSQGGGTTLRVLQWNVHHGGIGTDGKYDPNRVASWVAKIDPDVISFNEVDDQDRADALIKALKAKTGISWKGNYDDRGNLVLTHLKVQSDAICTVNPGVNRKASQITTVVNGRQINIWSAHLDESNGTNRLNETKVLQGCERNWPEARIAVGDFNMQQGSDEYQSMASGHNDVWLAAKALGTATNYSGNCDGCTRNSRIDYIFTSKGASALVLKSAQIVDTRDAKGVMPSDHKPMLATFTVK